jgi:hypothetical protein
MSLLETGLILTSPSFGLLRKQNLFVVQGIWEGVGCPREEFGSLTHVTMKIIVDATII